MTLELVNLTKYENVAFLLVIDPNQLRRVTSLLLTSLKNRKFERAAGKLQDCRFLQTNSKELKRQLARRAFLSQPKNYLYKRTSGRDISSVPQEQ